MSLSFNHFGFIDYKKPKNDIQMDYRTSYYHAHKILDDPKLQTRAQIQSDACTEYKPYGDMKIKSDFQENFVHPPHDPTLKRNPKLKCYKVNFMKPYDDTVMRFAPKSIDNYKSTYSSSFAWNQPYPPDTVSYNYYPGIPQNTEVFVNYARPGYSKHLDPGATTNRLDYPLYMLDQKKGIGSADHITYWNWEEKKGVKGTLGNLGAFPQEMCNQTESLHCPKLKSAFHPLIQPVPNFGMTTEVRSNFKMPTVETENTRGDVSNNFGSCKQVAFSDSTENKMYGSRDRIQKFVDVGQPKLKI